MPRQVKPTTTTTTDPPATDVYAAEIKALKAQIASLEKSLTGALAAIAENGEALSSEVSIIHGDVNAVTEAVDMMGPRLDTVEARPFADLSKLEPLGVELGATVKTLSSAFKSQTEATEASLAFLRQEVDKLAAQVSGWEKQAEAFRRFAGLMTDKVDKLTLQVEAAEAASGGSQRVTDVVKLIEGARDLLGTTETDWGQGQLAAFEFMALLLGQES